MNGRPGGVCSVRAPGGSDAANLRQARRVRLLLERRDLAVDVEAEDAHLGRFARRHRLRRNRDVGAALGVRLDELAVVHPVEVVAGEDQVVVGVHLLEVPARLAHGVRRALEPAAAVGRLLGRQDLDETFRVAVEPVGLADVTIERRRVELRQHDDLPDLRVQAVADRDIDEPVLPADGDRGLRPGVRQREESGAPAAAEDDRQHVAHGRENKWETRPAARPTAQLFPDPSRLRDLFVTSAR